jgi:hypothetical protein
MKKLKKGLRALGRGLADFLNPRDWVPTIPVPHKRDPDAQGYQTLGEALKGFPEKDDADR